MHVIIYGFLNNLRNVSEIYTHLKKKYFYAQWVKLTFETFNSSYAFKIMFDNPVMVSINRKYSHQCYVVVNASVSFLARLITVSLGNSTDTAAFKHPC